MTANAIVALRQVVPNGTLFALPPWLSWMSTALPARLGLAAAAIYSDLNTQRRMVLHTDDLWTHSLTQFCSLLGGLLLITVASLAAAVAVLRLRWRRRVEEAADLTSWGSRASTIFSGDG